MMSRIIEGVSVHPSSSSFNYALLTGVVPDHTPSYDYLLLLNPLQVSNLSSSIRSLYLPVITIQSHL